MHRPRNGCSMRRHKTLLSLLFVIVGFAYLAFTLASSSPAGKHWRYARMSLTEQLRLQEQYANDPIFLYHLSSKFNAKGQFNDALPFAERAVGLEPNDAQMRDEWTKAMLGTGQATQAYAQLKQYLAANPNSADAHFLVARYYVTQDKIIQAQKLLEETVALDPKYTRAWAILAPIYIKQGNKKLALTALETTLKLDPNQPGSHLQLAVLLASDNKETARQEFDRALALAPNDLNCREQYAHFLLSNQDFPGAEAQARKAAILNPGSLSANALLGQCLTMENKPTEALPYLNAAIALDPNDPTVAQNLMTAYSQLRKPAQVSQWQARYAQNARYTQEKRDLESAVAIHPEDRVAQRKLAAFLAASGNVDGCLLHNAAAEKAQPDSPRVLVATARDLDKAGYRGQALALVRRITQETHNNVEATETLADILLHMGRLHEAAINYDLLRDSRIDQKSRYQKEIVAAAARLAVSTAPSEVLFRQAQTATDPRISEQTLLKALELDPENTRFLRQLLLVQFSLSEKDVSEKAAAEKTARKLSAISPEDGLSQILSSVLLLEAAPAGTLDASLREELETRLLNAERDPTTLPPLYYAYGLLYLKEGKAQEAVKELTESIRLAPDSPAAYRRLAEAKQMAGDTNGARQTRAEYDRRVKRRQAPSVAVQEHISAPSLGQ